MSAGVEISAAAMGGGWFGWTAHPEAWVALATLTGLEIILGIDNIIFISILAGKLPPEQQKRARSIGLAAAMIMRVLLLLSISWVMKLTQPLITLAGHSVNGKDLILIIGGLFLLVKSTLEIHEKLEGHEGHSDTKVKASFMAVLVQIAMMDIIFSLDSVITAVGMSQHIPVMIIAVVLAVIFMMFFAGAVSNLVERHPTLKMLALSFLLLIGFALTTEGLHFKDSSGNPLHIPKSSIYFAMGFSVFVELLNIRLRRKTDPVKLHKAFHETAGGEK
jgi:predicted tellurium resistance membrane protein TerC